MNGEVKSYRLNDPMSWNEFKAMPLDIQINYILALRNRYGVSDTRIANMMGVSQSSFQRWVSLNGLGCGKGKMNGRRYDKEGWTAFVNGVKLPTKTEEAPEATIPEAVEETPCEADESPIAEPVINRIAAVPLEGNMTFKGGADKALATVAALLGTGNVRLNIFWEFIKEEGVC